jgi:hypothetical protein
MAIDPLIVTELKSWPRIVIAGRAAETVCQMTQEIYMD